MPKFAEICEKLPTFYQRILQPTQLRGVEFITKEITSQECTILKEYISLKLRYLHWIKRGEGAKAASHQFNVCLSDSIILEINNYEYSNTERVL